MTIKKVGRILTKPHFLFLIISVISGYFFLSQTPPLWGLDEPSHFSRAYQISDGRLVPDTSKENRGGLMPDNFYEVSTYRTNDILDEGLNGTGVLRRADVTDSSTYDRLLSKKFMESEHSYYWTASYSPVAYPGAAAGIAVARVFDLTVGQTFFMARLFSLFVYVAICFLALWLVRNKKIVWLFFIVALLPTAMFQASVVTADNVLNALTLVFFALFFRLFITKDTKKVRQKILISLLLVGAILPLIKINYIFTVFVLLLLPSTYFKSTAWQVVYKGGVVLLSVVPGLIWSQLTKVTDATTLSQRADQLPVNPSEQIVHVLHHPIEFIGVTIKSLMVHGDTYLHGLLLTISGNNIHMPVILVFVLLCILLLAAVYARDEIRSMKRQLLYMSIASIVAGISIFAALYAGFTPVGWWIVDGIQGRYFMPFLLPVIALISIYIPFHIDIDKKTASIMAIAAVSICLVTAITYNYLALY